MKAEIEKINILSTENFKAEDFVEEICSRNHLYNYFGSISVAISTALTLVSGKISVSFEKCVGGVVFAISCKEDIFQDIDFRQIGDEKTNSLFLINSLTDEIEVKDKGRTLELIFYVNGIAPELAMQRKEAIEQYSLKEVLVR